MADKNNLEVSSWSGAPVLTNLSFPNVTRCKLVRKWLSRGIVRHDLCDILSFVCWLYLVLSAGRIHHL